MPIFVKIVEKPSLRDQMRSILGDCVAGRILQEGQKMHPVGIVETPCNFDQNATIFHLNTSMTLCKSNHHKCHGFFSSN